MKHAATLGRWAAAADHYQRRLDHYAAAGAGSHIWELTFFQAPPPGRRAHELRAQVLRFWRELGEAYRRLLRGGGLADDRLLTGAAMGCAVSGEAWRRSVLYWLLGPLVAGNANHAELTAARLEALLTDELRRLRAAQAHHETTTAAAAA